MNDETNKLPFFINTKRLQRDDSYFDIGRTQDKLRKFLLDKRSRYSSSVTDKDWEEEYGTVGYYGVSRYISLEDDQEHRESEEDDFEDFDEDVQFDKTSGFQLFWMTFKRIAASMGDRLFKSTPARRSSDDIEYNTSQDAFSNEELCKIIVEPQLITFNDPRVINDTIVYGDVNYLIQKFRMDLQCGSLDVALFSVELPRTTVGFSDCTTDLQAFVVSPECGSYVWIENGRASAIFMTRSSEDFFGSIMEWFRKILSDMVLADSVMIGHPYYWQPTVRRRLTRVMKYLKRLYRTLARKEKQRIQMTKFGIQSPDRMEVVCPTDISKIVINEQPSRNLTHANTTYEKLNIMLEQLVKKWFDYHHNVTQSPLENVQDLSKTYTILQPYHTPSDDTLESVTFLDFFPHIRNYPPPSLSFSGESIPISKSPSNSEIRRKGYRHEVIEDSYALSDPTPGERSKYQSRDSNLNVHQFQRYSPNRTMVSEVFSASKCEEVDSELLFD